MRPMYNEESTLTGRYRARRAWFGKLILQVECNIDTIHSLERKKNTGTFWRDARAADVGMQFGSLSAPAVASVEFPFGKQ